MSLTREQMLEIFQKADATHNGEFITGVLTTGIYCLPSCKARKPKPENVQFYATPEDARAAGFRACKKCKPDEFYLGEFAGESLIEGLVESLFLEPARFKNVEALTVASGIGSSKLYELFRTHYHATPLEILMKARLEAACRALLLSNRPVTEIAFEVGFESLSSFNENFRSSLLLTPLEYRRMTEDMGFSIALLPDYPLEFILKHLARDSESLTERIEGHTYTAAWRLEGQICVLEVALEPERATVKVLSSALSAGAFLEVHAKVLGLMGLNAQIERFEGLLEGDPKLKMLLGGSRDENKLSGSRAGYRFPLLPSPFDGLVRAIVGQQITVGFAATLRRRLVLLAGEAAGHDLYAPVTPEALSKLEPSDLLELGFTRARADYLVQAARAVVEGKLPLETLRRKSAVRLERTLLAQRGIGPWTAHYLMMHAYGLPDCVPLGDTGLTEALKRFFALAERPDSKGTLEHMDAFRPFRSLATWHFWQYFYALERIEKAPLTKAKVTK